MAKSKMTVAEMIGLFLTPDAPVQVTAFDGSVFGQDQAPLHLEVKNSRAMYYITENPNDLGLARAYLQGDLDSPELLPGNPYQVLKELMGLKHFVKHPSKMELARARPRSLGFSVM